MENSLCSLIGRFAIVKILICPKLIYSSKAITIKISVGFCKNPQANSKLYNEKAKN